MKSPIRHLLRHAPPGQVVRYLVVGVWNTLFGYGLFALLTYLLTPRIPYAYMAASVLSHVVAVTVAFVGYKRFVFRTQGNFLREYFRCYVVYGTTFLVSFSLLPVLVFLLNLMMDRAYSPYVAGAILTAGNVVLSFFGHQRYTFGRKPEESELSAPLPHRERG